MSLYCFKGDNDMILKDLLQGKTTSARRKVLRSNVKKSKHIAIAFKKNGSFIASATNQLIQGRNDKFSLHSEEALVLKLKKIKAKERFGPLTVLVMRWSPSAKWTLSRPCKSCQRLLEEYGIDTILFTTNQGYSK